MRVPRRSPRIGWLGLAGAAALACHAGAAASGRQAPPFPASGAEAWIGPPQSLDGLRGRVVLLDVWTFG